MVSRTRIPVAMTETGADRDDPVSRTVISAAMTKDGDGKQYIREQMMPDYACCDNPGYYFISSPLNVYSIGRSGAVVLYVEGGCPPFTWAASGSWATFSSAETSVRYNTLNSTADAGADVTVTVTDLCSGEVTISVPWNGALNCCDDPPTLSIQSLGSELNTALWPGEAVVFIDGGCPPFTWSVTGAGYTLDYATTNSRRNRLVGEVGAIGGEVSVTDYCGLSACISCDFNFISSRHWKMPKTGLTQDVEVEYGKLSISWAYVGTHSGWSVGSTGDRTALARTTNATTESVILRATDDCESKADKNFVLSCAPKALTHQFRQLSSSYIDGHAIKLSECNVCVAVGNDKNLRTFTVNETTGLVSSQLSSVAFTANYTFKAKVVEIAGSSSADSTIVAVAYTTTVGTWVATYEITHSTGAISTVIDSEQAYNVYSTSLDFIWQRAQIYVVGICTPSSGVITGVGIDGAGNIATDFVHSHLFTETFIATQPSYITMCKGTYDQDLALAYRLESSGHGFIQTWDIEEGGIGAAFVQSTDFADSAYQMDMVPISYANDGYVIVYKESSGDGQIKVFSQDADNEITQEESYDTSYLDQPTIVNLKDDCFGVLCCHYSAGWRWSLRTYLIDTFSDYQVRSMEIKSFVNGNQNYNSQILKISDSIVAGLVVVSDLPTTGYGVTSMEIYCND